MAGITESRTWDSLLTTTLANYRKKIVDNIFDTYPLLSYLNGKLGNIVRGESVKRLVDGGESIVEHVLYESNTTVKSYAGYETLDTTPAEGHTIARYDWKQYSGVVAISGLEKRNNNGESAMINLLQAKIFQLEQSMRDKLSRDAWSDGTGNGSKELGGMQTICSATTTLGGLAPATYAWWVADTNALGGALTLAAMSSRFNTVTRGNDKPDIVFTTQARYESYEALLQTNERFSNTSIGDGGFTNLLYKSVPVMFDRDCPTNNMYFLNSKWLSFVVHRQADMAMSPMQDRFDQDAFSSKMILQAEITTNNRRNLSVLTGITS